MTIPCNTDIQSLLYMLLSTPYHPLFPPIKWSKELFNRFFPGKDYSDEYAILSDHFPPEIHRILETALPNKSASMSQDDITISPAYYPALLRFIQLHLKRLKPNGRRCTTLCSINTFEKPITLIEFLLANFDNCLTYNYSEVDEVQYLINNICIDNPSLLTDFLAYKKDSVKKLIKHIKANSKLDSTNQLPIVPYLFRMIQIFFHNGKK
jgi:hypothetical protein